VQTSPIFDRARSLGLHAAQVGYSSARLARRGSRGGPERTPTGMETPREASGAGGQVTGDPGSQPPAAGNAVPQRVGFSLLAVLPAEFQVVQPEATVNTPRKLTRNEFTPEMLTGDLTPEMLAQVENPAELIEARLEAIRQPTAAAVRNAVDGSEQPLNPSQFSTREQAEAMLARLRALGLDVSEIEEVQFGAGPFALDFKGDQRRIYTIHGMNVGLLLERYARYTKEYADQLTLQEWELMQQA